MGASTVENTLIDFRGSGKKRPIWEATLSQMSWADNNTDTISSTVGVNGVIKRITATYSAADANMTLTVDDADGNEVLAPGQVADGQVKIYDADGTDFGENQLAFFDGFIVNVVATDPGATGVTADITVVGM